MRAADEGLGVARSLMDGLPALYHADDFVVRMMAAFDTVLAPVHAVVDNLDAYCDPRLAPDDFLPWLARWVGVPVDERSSVRRRRELVAAAADLYRRRGTVSGVASAVALATGAEPEIVENGGCAYAPSQAAPFPGRPGPSLVVRVRTSDPDLDRAALDALVAETKPAHVPHRVVVVPVDG